MKNTLLSLAAVVIAASSAFADVSREDIKKLSAAGVSDDVIVAFIKANGPAPKLSADDIVDLKKSGVSDKVVEAMMANQGVSPRVLEGGAAQGGGAAENYNGPSIQPPGTRYVERVYVDRPVYVPTTTYYYSTPSVGVVWCRSHGCYDRCGYTTYYSPSYYTPTYYSSYPSYSYTYYRSSPSWGFSYYSGSSCHRRSRWGISIRW